MDAKKKNKRLILIVIAVAVVVSAIPGAYALKSYMDDYKKYNSGPVSTEIQPGPAQ